MKDDIVIIRDMCAGNESVGEMWQETKIFKKTDTLEDVLNWATDSRGVSYTRKRITITIPHD